MFYLTSSITYNDNQEYVVTHRTFPGTYFYIILYIFLNWKCLYIYAYTYKYVFFDDVFNLGIEKNITTYDPTKRGWFKNAPENAFYLYGQFLLFFLKMSLMYVYNYSFHAYMLC